MSERSPYYHLVPKDFKANLKFRQELMRAAIDSPQFQQELWCMCARDLLFYVNAFCWTYDPRRNPGQLPFITYEFQDPALLELDDAIGNHDMLIEKSRDMGASHLCMIPMEWRWHFHDLCSFLLVSRKEDLVDRLGDPKSLMWKLDFFHKFQPGWLKPHIKRNKLHMMNCDTGSTIDGESTTGDVARGDRRTAIMLDEFASVEDGHKVLAATADATDCRVFNSTPKGTANAFYKMVGKCEHKLRLHWADHPIKGKGRYQDAKGKWRSPWYDREVARRAHPAEVAQEIDIDYLGAQYQWFDGTLLERHKAEHVRPPYAQGDISYDFDTNPIEFAERDKGPLLLWVHLDGHQEPPKDRRYVMGIDVSAGTGASNSCFSVLDCKTGEKVAEYATPFIRPEEFAKVCVSAARFFGGATMIWETNGPGRNFGDAVLELGYRNIYYRRREESMSKKMSDVPGWPPTKEGKIALLGAYRRSLHSHEFINRSWMALEECNSYIYLPSGGVEHSSATDMSDPTGARSNHGDRVIADALANHIRAFGITYEEPEAKIPVGSLAARREDYAKAEVDLW